MRNREDFYNILVNINFSFISVSDNTRIEVLFIINTLTYLANYSDILLTHST